MRLYSFLKESFIGIAWHARGSAQLRDRSSVASRWVYSRSMSANIKPATAAANYPELSLFIDGEWLGAQGRKTQPVINPANEEVLGHLPHASAADLDRALAAAQRAWGEWRALLPVARGKILKKAADLMGARDGALASIARPDM